MSVEPPLFRSEVLDSDSKRALGDVVLVYPISNYAMVLLALGLLSVLVLFAVLGHYTRHVTVSGVLEPGQGVVKLYASQGGVLKTLRVKEGQMVKKGEVLLVFDTEHSGAHGEAIEAELDSRLLDRLATLHSELGSTLKLQEADVVSMRQNLVALQNNRATLTMEMQTQQKRVASSEKLMTRFEHLQQSGFMSAIQTQQKADDLMDQQLRMQALQKTATSADAEIARLTSELANSPLRRQVAKAQIDRNISSTESELSRQKSNHEWSVIAPCDGMVSSLTIANNQNAGTGVSLVSIIPSDSQLQANLYAPSRALGFVQRGQVVKMKLDAFPYQKFGLVQGRVISIADSPVRAAESSAGTRLAVNGETGEPLYTIRVALDKQVVDAYGQAQRLRPGMQIEAEIEIDTRLLYEWVLEPLYSLRRG